MPESLLEALQDIEVRYETCELTRRTVDDRKNILTRLQEEFNYQLKGIIVINGIHPARHDGGNKCVRVGIAVEKRFAVDAAIDK